MPALLQNAPGQRGLCFVRRAREDGAAMVLTGLRSLDWILRRSDREKPLNHFLPGTPVLSFGTAGCNLACKFCQNWDISKSRESGALDAHAPSPDTIAAPPGGSGARSVAYTYNDPVIFLEYALDVRPPAARAA